MEYKYDAWSAPTYIYSASTACNDLAYDNPFRYRGYVWDEESELYYLRSRYYNPELGRFLNGDCGVKKSDKLLRDNLFGYCSCNPLSKIDTEGKDAYWITNNEAAMYAGHVSLLIEDDNGDWFYFYWGPEEISLQVTAPAKVQVDPVEVSFASNGLLDLDALNKVLIDNDIYDGEYDSAVYFRGDYTRSLNYAKLLRQTYEESIFRNVWSYNLLFSNCMQASATVMRESNPINENPYNFLLFTLAITTFVPKYTTFCLSLDYPTIYREQK